MRKTRITLLIILVLFWACGTLFGQGGGRGKGGGEKSKQTGAKKVEEKGKGQQDKLAEAQKRVREQQRDRQQERVRERERTRQARKRMVRGKAEDKGETAERGTAKGKEHQQQLKAVKRQMAHEVAKHRNRVARLRRIRQLATEEGKTETVERVDKLLEKEQKRYDSKWQRMQERRQKILQFGEKTVGEEGEETTAKGADKGKPGGKRAREGQRQR